MIATVFIYFTFWFGKYSFCIVPSIFFLINVLLVANSTVLNLKTKIFRHSFILFCYNFTQMYVPTSFYYSN